MDEAKIDSIIETLTEKIYSHGHGIGRKEAMDIGLSIESPDDKIEKSIWDLYLKYENFLKLLDPLHPELELNDLDEKDIDDLPLAIIESSQKLHIYKTKMKIIRKRNIPPSPQVNVNANLQLPPGFDPSKPPQQLQRIVEKMLEEISSQIPNLVMQEIKRQSPVEGVRFRPHGGRWAEEKRGENQMTPKIEISVNILPFGSYNFISKGNPNKIKVKKQPFPKYINPETTDYFTVNILYEEGGTYSVPKTTS